MQGAVHRCAAGQEIPCCYITREIIVIFTQIRPLSGYKQGYNFITPTVQSISRKVYNHSSGRAIRYFTETQSFTAAHSQEPVVGPYSQPV